MKNLALDASASGCDRRQGTLWDREKKKKTWRFLVAFLTRIVRQIQENYLKPYINKSKSDRNLVLNK